MKAVLDSPVVTSPLTVGDAMAKNKSKKPTKKKTTKAAKPPDEVYQLGIKLLGTDPPIWRMFAVPSGISLPKLHDVIQIVMGWWDSHLHQFRVGETRYGEPDPVEPWDDDMINERRVKLRDLLHEQGATICYEYDFGDGWEHELKLTKVGPPEEGVRYPICLAGERNCPPEDCGGIYGFAELLEVIADPKHEEHESMMEWLGGGYDPEKFDVDVVNGRLNGLR